MTERLRLLSFIDGEGGYCALLAGPDGAGALRATERGTLEARSMGPLEEGRAKLAAGTGELDVSWSPAGSRLEFGFGGEVVGAQPIALSGRDGDASLAGPGVAWDLPEGGYAALRTLWAASAGGSLTLLVAMREAGSREHGEELVGAARMIPGAEPYGYLEPLLSTEYDGAGAHVRATLELWPTAEEPAPERGGGLRTAGGALEGAEGRLEAARFAWSLDGSPASGGYEILTR